MRKINNRSKQAERKRFGRINTIFDGSTVFGYTTKCFVDFKQVLLT